MPGPDRPTPLFAVVLAAFLTVASIVTAVIAVSSSGDGGVAGITGGPGASAGPNGLLAAVASAGPSSLPSADATGSALPTLGPSPDASEIAQPSPTPTPKPVLAMNLYRKGDFVSQATAKQCVAAAMQNMLNMISPSADTSKTTQARLASLAKQLSDARDGGTEPLGWARGLARRGGGAYEVRVAPNRGAALDLAIRAMRATGRPVGLLVWRGAHSWVLHGYETTVDPALGTPMAVKAIFVTDPWYPRISSIWGASRGPNARITPTQLAEDYLPWRRPTGRYPGMDGRYVLVIPVAPPTTG
jgi:hypothetical protein